MIHGTRIKNLALESKCASTLNSILNREWPEIGRFEREKYGLSIPSPIGVFVNDEIVGGLSFTSYKAPGSEDVVTWVNAVYVLPNYRGKGYARKLVLAAQLSAECLFALTDIPALYTGVGWRTVSQDSDGAIVQYEKIT